MVVKVGVIGCGWFGSAHARVYRQIGDAELVAVMDKDESAARRLGEAYHVNYYTSIDEMLIKEEIDAVSIVVTPHKLFEASMEVLDQGVSLLVEKPVVVNRQELDELLTVVRNKGVIFMPGFIELFNLAVIKAKEILEKGDIGEILALWSRRVGRTPKKKLGWKIGVSLDLAIHELYVFNHIMGRRPTKIASYKARVLNGDGEGEDLAIFLMNYGKVVGSIETNWLTPVGIREMLISGEKGTVIVDYVNQEVRVNMGDVTVIPRYRKKETLLSELEYFVSHVKEGTNPEIGVNITREVLETLFDGLETDISLGI